jgi:hypothetical protein
MLVSVLVLKLQWLPWQPQCCLYWLRLASDWILWSPYRWVASSHAVLCLTNGTEGLTDIDRLPTVMQRCLLSNLCFKWLAEALE